MAKRNLPPKGRKRNPSNGDQAASAVVKVPFHGAELAALAGGSPATTIVAMKPMTEGMGLDWGAQHKKLMQHPVLSTCVSVKEMQMPGDDQVREWVFLPLNRVNFWLATLHPNRIEDPATRAKVIEYQTECADALFAHFFGRALDNIGATPLTAREHGGITKAVVSRAVGELRDEFRNEVTVLRHEVADVSRALIQVSQVVYGLVKMADARRAVLDYRKAVDVANDIGIPVKGRRGVVTTISNKLASICDAWDLHPRICPVDGARMFSVEVVEYWKRKHGAEFVANYIATRTNGPKQIPLFDTPKKPRRKRAASPVGADTFADASVYLKGLAKILEHRAKNIAVDLAAVNADMLPDALRLHEKRLVSDALKDGINRSEAETFARRAIELVTKILDGKAA